MTDLGSVITVSRDVAAIARSQQLTLLAAGVAFYAFLSLVPLGLLAVGVAATIGGEALAVYVAEAAGGVLTPSAQELLAETILDDTGRRSATVIGALGLIWGSSRVFRGLDRAFSAIYGTVASKSLLDTFWDALIVAIAVTGGFVLVSLLEVALLLSPIPWTGVLAPLLVFIGLVAGFLPMYLIFPGAEVSVREALPGTLVSAVGWIVLSRAFGIYAGFAGEYTFYGALGAVLLVLLWLYLASILVVFGAVVNAVLADRELDRQLQSPTSRHLGQRAMTDDDRAPEDGPSESDDAGERSGVGDSSRPEDAASPTDAADRAGADDEADTGTSAGGDDPAGSGHTTVGDGDRTRDRASDPEALREEIERLRDDLESFEDDVASRTVEKESLERELKGYVRSRVRRGHAHGWGPYLVLGYGTAMSIAAFYFLSGGWAILAMFVVWTSTLGVYLLMVLFGAVVSLLGLPGRLRNRIGGWRS